MENTKGGARRNCFLEPRLYVKRKNSNKPYYQSIYRGHNFEKNSAIFFCENIFHEIYPEIEIDFVFMSNGKNFVKIAIFHEIFREIEIDFTKKT